MVVLVVKKGKEFQVSMKREKINKMINYNNNNMSNLNPFFRTHKDCLIMGKSIMNRREKIKKESTRKINQKVMRII